MCIRDRSCSLPSVEKWRNDYPKNYSAKQEEVLTTREIFFKYVLNNKLLWFIAIANALDVYKRQIYNRSGPGKPDRSCFTSQLPARPPYSAFRFNHSIRRISGRCFTEKFSNFASNPSRCV